MRKKAKNYKKSKLKFSLEKAMEYVEELHDSIGNTKHSRIFKKILRRIKIVDFEELAASKGFHKLNDKAFIILTVEELLKQLNENGWGIYQKDGFVNVYNGSYWSNVNLDEVTWFLGEAAQKMGVNPGEAKYYAFKDKLAKQLFSESVMKTVEKSKVTTVINVYNGTIEFSENGAILREFRKEDLLFYQLPFSFNPQASAPLFMNYLNKALPDKESQTILSEYLGYIFLKPSILKLEKMLILFGPSRSGKSVMHDIIIGLIGAKNVSAYALDSLTNKNSFDRAGLLNMLLNYATEMNISGGESNLLKAIISGEDLPARAPHGLSFILREYCKFIFNCNKLPNFDFAEEILNRLLILKFSVQIPEEEQDKQLAKKIIESELPGVLNWVIDGLNRLLERPGFSDCKAAKDAIKEFALQSNNVKLFIVELGYEKSTNKNLLLKNFYDEYRSFCTEEGYAPVKKHEFISRIKGLGIAIQKKNIGNVVFVTK